MTASGLLYIAELVEEHSRLAKLVGQRTIYVSDSSFFAPGTDYEH